MNKDIDTADCDNLMMQRHVIFSAINKNVPNRQAMAGLGWTTLFSIVLCFLLTVREEQMFQPCVRGPAGK